MKRTPLLLLLILLIACNTEQKKRNAEIEKLKDEAISIIAKAKTKIDLAEINKEGVWNVNTDSIMNEWRKIHNDSAELGLVYMQNFDSLFQKKCLDFNEVYKEKKEAEKKELKSKISRLKSKFTYKKDEFQDVGFYTHKRWGKYWPNRKTLTSGVNSTGYAWLRSNYSADDWLFHTSITVLIGDQKYKSPVVETYDKNNRTDNDGGRIWEVVTYDDQEILSAVSENTNSTIKVRFHGREFYDDITLSAGDKRAIKDCYDLANLLKELDE